VTVNWMKPRCRPAIAICLLVAGCGGGGKGSTAGPAGGGGQGSSAAASAATSAEAGVPSEAQSAATGDIPDNQAFLTFADGSAGYSIRYPEGWTRRGAAGDVTFQDRANVIHVTVASGPPPTPADASSAIADLRRADPTVKGGVPQRVTINGSPVIKVTYTRLSAADPVTAKRLALTIDRYEYAHGGKTAIVDLDTPKGVDNVDAYRMISRSFRWR
jgi:hypothetical protein